MLLGNARLIHKVPGQLRIEVPELYHCAAEKRRLEAQLADLAGVLEVCANPLTGRVLIRLDRRCEPPALFNGLATSPAAARASRAPDVPGVRPHGTPPAPGEAPVWYLRSPEDALQHFASSGEHGLTKAEAEVRLRQGRNTVALAPPRSSLAIFLGQFNSLPIMLLGVSAAVSVLTGAMAEAVAIGSVLACNAGIGYVTERRAEDTITSLSELVDDSVQVVRDGVARALDAALVVPGDVLLLHPGSRIAADMRLLHADELTVDESALTGESIAVRKQSAALTAPAGLAERRNMAYRGTAVSSGSGRGVVVATGAATEAGAIEILVHATGRPQTPIEIQLAGLGRRLVLLSCALCVGIFALGLVRGRTRESLFKTVISLAIAAVPEGLPTVATTSLAKGIRRMRERQVLIRNLHAVETLGSIQTICLDKTGTLTLNRMSAAVVRTTAAEHDADALDGATVARAPELYRLMQVLALCKESPEPDTRSARQASASATETALALLATRCGMSASQLSDQFRLISLQLRAPGRNYMRTVHQLAQSPRQLTAVKGNPEEVLALCSHYLQGDRAIRLDSAHRAALQEQNVSMAGRGLRVLGAAFAEDGAQQDPGDLTWLGLVGLADPLRPGVTGVMDRFHAAGISTIMLTGDQPGTASEIGKAAHLNGSGELHVVDAHALSGLDPEQLRALGGSGKVFARVTPADKLRIVQALQASGQRVAMTGDGINDSPALRAADVGIAMGSGAAVALSVADVALKDDHLEPLLEAIAQGRTLADNIRKSIHFLVSSNLSEIMVVAGTVALGKNWNLSPLQLLWVNLLTDILPAIALADEPSESGVMQRPPRDPGDHLVGTRDMLRYGREAGYLSLGALGAGALGALRYGPGARASTMGFDTMVLGQMLHAWYCRTEGRSSFAPDLPANRSLNLAIAASLALQGLAHILPGLRRLLGLSVLGPLDVLGVLAGAGLPLLANEVSRDIDRSNA